MSIQRDGIKKNLSNLAIIILVFVAFLIIPAQAAEINGQVWNDSNRDGVHDIGELGIGNISICHYTHHNWTCNWGGSPNGCTSTDVNGYYSLNLSPSCYHIYADIPSDYVLTSDPSTWCIPKPLPLPGEIIISYEPINYEPCLIHISEGEIINNYDFGVYQLTPPPADVVILQQMGTEGSLPTVYAPELTNLTIQRTYENAIAIDIELKWPDGTFINESMVEVNTSAHIWEVEISPPDPLGFPSGTVQMTFYVDNTPPTPPWDIIQIGDMVFLDPSGQVFDWCSGLPINGAKVTLYLYDPDTGSSTVCPEGNIYPEGTPKTFFTGSDGGYLWNTLPGSYFVVAQKEGYVTTNSSIVSVPPPATGLDIYLKRLSCPSCECSDIPVHSLDLELTQVQIFPQGADKFQIQGTITLDVNSDGIDPITNGTNIRLFLPNSLPGSGQFYPIRNDNMPVYLQETPGGWTITLSEKGRTGIQDLKILKTNDPGIFTFILVDTKSALETEDYRNIIIEVSSGNDAGVINIALTERNGKYSL